jgi:hypothetical protein
MERPTRLATTMALFGMIGVVATTAVIFIYLLSTWELLSAQARCDCTFEVTSPGVIARTLGVLVLTMARAFAELHAAQRLLSSDPRARRRGISVYIAVAVIHCIVAPLWVDGFAGLPLVALASWPIVVAVAFARGDGAGLPRAYVRR